MEIVNLALCCALITVVVAFTIPDEVTDFNRKNYLLDLVESQACKCKNGRCVTDNRGKTKCNCAPGYVLQDEFTCEKCDCGKLGRCTFVSHKSSEGIEYEKKCLCDVGSAVKDGKCINCHCGENSKCEFEEDEKNCYCMEGYSEKDGVCTKCDCGFYGECKFYRGYKNCTCDEGYMEHAGECKECICGDFGVCNLINGLKTCTCNNGFADNAGTCEKCDCGRHSVACGFKNGEKVCTCKVNSAQKREECVECNCESSAGCSFLNDKKTCNCLEGYVQKGDTCKVRCGIFRPCQNGGYCSEGICKCLPGTSGEFCETIDECNNLCPKRPDIRCSYDTKLHKAFCDCIDKKMGFHPKLKDCKPVCDDNLFSCSNGGQCTSQGYSKFCHCLKGTSGYFCEVIPECSNKRCGDSAKCVYDVNKKSAVCKCRVANKAFDPEDLRCKATCNNVSPCKNGGYCKEINNSRFCRCLEGTVGDFCQIVPLCNHRNCGNEAKCVYGIKERSAVCKCHNASLILDPESLRCKRTCQSSSDCMNGGTCYKNDFAGYCRCLDGTKGDFCEQVPGCNAKDCGDKAKCVYDVDKRMAVCACVEEDYSFDSVDFKCRRTCRYSSDCKNGGKCSETDSSRFCRCLEGTDDDFCEKVIGCETTNCGHDATCVFDAHSKSAMCLCNNENLSFDPEDVKCKRKCEDDYLCQNGGKCRSRSRGRSHFCECLSGTSGDLCEIVDECKKEVDKCKGESKCSFDIDRKKVFCKCPGGKEQYDPLDGRCKNTCNHDADCKNGARCMYHGDNLFCECKKGTRGAFCEVVEECVRGACGNLEDTTCHYDVNSKTVKCGCKDPNSLYDRVTKTCRACDCGRNTISCSFEQGLKVCVCKDGFTEEDGICKKKWCTEKNCFHGKCEVNGEEEVCSCYEGFVLDGDYCRKMNCSRTPCINGTCVVRHGNKEECICPAGYSLNRDICIRGACRMDTCFGGQCKKIDGELMCVCPDRFNLEGIGCYETVCKEQHCFGGKCVVKNDEEICTCPENHKLVRNVCKRIVCEQKNCFGGQCNIINGAEECTCPKGFFLFEDVCREVQTREQ